MPPPRRWFEGFTLLPCSARAMDVRYFGLSLNVAARPRWALGDKRQSRCVSARNIDLTLLRSINYSGRRSAFGPHAEQHIGSEKQIKWAESIRKHWLSTVNRDIPPSSDALYRAAIWVRESTEDSRERAEAVQQAITCVLKARLAATDEIVARSKASWWIHFQYNLGSVIDKATDAAAEVEFSPASLTRGAKS
jgi:hypothetical protein